MRYFSFLFLGLVLFSSCRKDPRIVDIGKSGFPHEVGKIMLTECAVEGCHNTASHQAAGGLNLESWDKLFQGGNNGAVVVPFKHWLSQVFLFTNTYEHLGLSLEPVMPFNDEPLTEAQVIRLRDWINQGAPDREGHVKFENSYSKFYVTNQGCDLVSVFDQETGLMMRAVEVGVRAAIESPHMIKVAPDGKHWYVCFTNGQVLQKFDASTDKLVASIDLTNGNTANEGNWNTISISNDSKKAYVVDWSINGKVAIVDLVEEKLATPFSYIAPLEHSHGSVISPDGEFLYITSQTGNYLHKITLSDLSDVNKISLDGDIPNNASGEDPHEIIFSPDGTRYFVSCQGTNEIRVFSYPSDQFIASLPTGNFPQEFDLSVERNLLFVSCTEDDITYPGHRGTVDVFDMTTLARKVVKPIKAGFQSHGLAVDDEKGLVYVANRNASSAGPAPHHTTDCGGRNGYITAIDMDNMQLLPGFRPEVSVDPYSMSLRK